MTAHVVILGGGGQLGSAVSKPQVWPDTYRVTRLTRHELDVTNAAALEAMFKTLSPIDWVINAAGFLPVDRAQAHPQEALRVNGLALFDIASACKAHGAKLLHVSTDHVFDGKKDQPYKEDDPTNPLNIYGCSKRIGELILASLDIPHIVLRTAWLYGVTGNTFVQKVWAWSKEKRTVSIVDDQLGCPTHVEDVARGIATMITSQVDRPNPETLGTFHFCGAQKTSWHGFGTAILEAIQREQGAPSPLTLLPTSTAAFREQNPSVAPRPLDGALDCKRIQQSYGIQPVGYGEQLSNVVRLMLNPFVTH